MGRKKITFKATKRKPTKVRVSFRTKDGRRISLSRVHRKPKRIRLASLRGKQTD